LALSISFSGMSSSLKGTISSSALTPVKMKEIYILVMGLTGAGKSTFISIVTGDNSIPIGNPDDMDGSRSFQLNIIYRKILV